MVLIDGRLLRGPNVHSERPCYVAHLDLGPLADAEPARIAGSLARLGTALPGFIRTVSAVPDFAHLVLEVVLALQRQAGTPVDFGRVLGVHGAPGQRRLVCGYQFEAVVEQAMATAVAGVNAAAQGDEVEFAAPLDTLRALVRARKIDPRTLALLDAARARDLPVLRLEETGHQFQLGWGSRQRRVDGLAEEAATAPIPVDRVATLDALFPTGSTGRIPVVAITGTNGKTTTTLLIAHGMKAGGARVGTTTTQGIFIDGRTVELGDCTGYWSARTVLTSLTVDVATLETARGGLLKRGLAFDRCDVGVVLNVSSDHLGLDGVETLADLARVKGLVARRAATAAVLNAEDPYCAAMATDLRPGCEAVFFSMDAAHPVLTDHLAAGGRAAYHDAGWLVWCEHGKRQRVLEAARMPIALHGHARYNIANALAALAALSCMGRDLGEAAAALVSFVSDARNNPLRANRFDVAGIAVIVDYAHNVVAYRALCEMARSMLAGRAARLLGVITSPGDRRASDLFDVGAVCGGALDELVVYEQDPRGRGAGETTAAILAGARSAAGGKPLHAEPEIRTALTRALKLARPGDVLVFTCAGTLADLVEGVRGFDAVEARRLAAELAS